MEPTTKSRAEWAQNHLTAFLTDLFPLHRTKPGRLAVYNLAEDISRTAPSINTWLHDGKLSVDNAKLLLALASTEKNVAALADAGRAAPKIEDFLPFLLA